MIKRNYLDRVDMNFVPVNSIPSVDLSLVEQKRFYAGLRSNRKLQIIGSEGRILVISAQIEFNNYSY